MKDIKENMYHCFFDHAGIKLDFLEVVNIYNILLLI